MRKTSLIPLSLAIFTLSACNEYELTGEKDDPAPPEDTATTTPPTAIPVAIAGPGTAVKRGTTVTLDGRDSYDPDGQEPLSYAWTVVSAPDGATTDLQGADTATPTFSGDVLGFYELSLTVTDADGLVSDNPAGTVIEVIPWSDLAVTLTWGEVDLDLDLHLIAPGGAYYGEGDCYYGVPTPDWGELGVEDDNPSLSTDAESTGEPELIQLQQPAEGIYTIYVHFFNDLDAPVHFTTPHLEIVAEGQEIVAMDGPRLTETGVVWVAGTLDWSTLTFTSSSTVTTHEDLGGPPVNEKE